MIREMMNSDFKEVIVLIEELSKMHVQARPDVFDAAYEDYDQNSFEEMINDQDYLKYVFVENAEILALIIAKVFERSGIYRKAKIIYIEDLYVKKKARQKGIAKMLMKKIEDKAQMLKIQTIELMVWDLNQEGLAFYDKMGYKNRSYIKEKII